MATFKDFIRMCKKSNCNTCPFYDISLGYDCIDELLSCKDIDKYDKLIDKWVKENPVRTRLSEFLKMFPNAPLKFGLPHIDCIHDIDKEYKCDLNCEACGEKYWNEEI